MKRSKVCLLAFLVLGVIYGCPREADIASQNLSTAADQFQIVRRVTFYDAIQGKVLLSIEGLCSLGNYDKERELTCTCKTGKDTYKKHFLGLSDNVTYFAEQIDPYKANIYHYKVILRPEILIPDIDLETSIKK